MKLISIELKNIGLYKNQTIMFDNTSKSSTIFWGNNGAGKTTLLNSIKIGLLGSKIYPSDYDSYCNFIKDELISTRCDNNKKNAYIIVNIELKENNELNKYAIKRQWKIIDDSLDEKLSVYKENEELNFTEKENLINKINNILPSSLLDVIIFDGENAINVLNNNQMHKLIKNIIYAVFGMDVYSNLIKDLNTYLRTQSCSTEENSESQLKLIYAEENYKKLLLEFKKNNVLIENTSTGIKFNLNKLRYELNNLSEKTGVKFENISEFENELVNIEDKKKQLETEIKNISEEVLPLKILHKKIKNLIEKLSKEEPLLIVRNINQLENYFKNDKNTLDALKNIKDKITNDTDIEIKFNLTDNQQKNIKDIDFMLDKYNRVLLLDYFKNRNSLFNSIKEKLEAEAMLNDSNTKKKLSEINILTLKINELNKELNEIKIVNKTVESNLGLAKSEYDSIKKSIRDENKESNSYINVTLYKDALEEFLKLNIEDICDKLNTKILYRLLKIGFRNDSITKVLISPRTFEIKLYEKDGKLIPSKLFSAGEKQILLGLIIKEALDLSKIDTFFLFDTPVGRLDMKNRSLFTDEVILKCSDQVCVFATDSDYSLNDYNLIKDKITSEYKLARNSKDEIVVKKGSIY